MYNAYESRCLQMTGVLMHAQCLMQSKFVSHTIGHYMQAASRVMEVSKVGAGVDDGVGHIDILTYWIMCNLVQMFRCSEFAWGWGNPRQSAIICSLS